MQVYQNMIVPFEFLFNQLVVYSCKASNMSQLDTMEAENSKAVVDDFF